jgi:hypothetical protein
MPDDPIHKRTEDFSSLYANNFRFEGSAWDIKIIFGELEQGGGIDPQSSIEFHTAVTLPWPVAKIMAYYLVANVASREHEGGPIFVRRNVIPPRPDGAEPEWAKTDPRLTAYLAWVHDQFFGSGYVPPEVQALTQNAPDGKKP